MHVLYLRVRVDTTHTKARLRRASITSVFNRKLFRPNRHLYGSGWNVALLISGRNRRISEQLQFAGPMETFARKPRIENDTFFFQFSSRERRKRGVESDEESWEKKCDSKGDIVVAHGRRSSSYRKKGFCKDCRERTKRKYDSHETRCWIRCQSKSFEHVSLIILASRVIRVFLIVFSIGISISRCTKRVLNCIPQFLIHASINDILPAFSLPCSNMIIFDWSITFEQRFPSLSQLCTIIIRNTFPEHAFYAHTNAISVNRDDVESKDRKKEGGHRFVPRLFSLINA